MTNGNFKYVVLFAILFFAGRTFAANDLPTETRIEPGQQACNLNGDVVFAAPPFEIHCDGDLLVAEGTVVHTGGQDLTIFVGGVAQFPSKESGGFKIDSGVEGVAGNILIHAATAVGFLSIDSLGYHTDGTSADVLLSYITTDDYDQDILAEPDAAVSLELNAYSYALSPDTHQILDRIF